MARATAESSTGGNRRAHLTSHEVHRVGPDRDQLGAGRHQRESTHNQDFAGFVPPARSLQLRDLVEVGLPQDHPGTVVTPEARGHIGVHQSVVLLGRIPRQATDQSDPAHHRR